MDSTNWRPTQGVSGGPVGDPSMEFGDWRAQLPADARPRIVNKIMETLKRHLPFSGLEGLQEIKKTAVRFEEKIYSAATSQSDYLRKISLKMLTMEARSQNPMPDAMQANNGFNPLDPGMETRSENPTLDAMQANNGLNPLDPGFKWQPEGGPSVESGDWRVQLQPDSRERIVNKIMGTLKRHLPFSGHEGLQELKKVAVRFEDNIYTTATSQSDYLRKISLKMLTMEARSQNPMPDAMQANNGLNPLDPVGNVASGHQAPSISDMARDNVSQPSGGTHSYSRDQSAPSWNALYNRDSSPMMIESDNAKEFTGDECGWNDMSEVSSESIVQGQQWYTFL